MPKVVINKFEVVYIEKQNSTSHTSFFFCYLDI